MRPLPSSAWGVAGAATVFVPAAWSGATDPVTRHELAIIVWATILLGLLAGVLPRAIPSRSARPVVIGLGGFAALSMLALLWTSSSERTVEEVARIAGYGGLVVLGLITVNRRAWKPAATGIFLGASGMCALAVIARLDPQSFPDPAAAISGGRLSYPLGYWNALATWAAMTLAFALAWSSNSRNRWARRGALALTPMIGSCLYLTYSRGGVAVAAVGVAVVIALSSDRGRATAHAIAAFVLTVVVAVVIKSQSEIATASGAGGATLVLLALIGACILAGLVPRFTEGRGRKLSTEAMSLGTLTLALAAFIALVPAIYGTLGAREPVAADATSDPGARLLTSNGNRPLYWSVALKDFADAPLQGTGPGTYGFSWTKSGKSSEEVLDAHSLYIEELGELGLPGLVAVLLLVTGALSHAALPLRLGQRGSAAVAMPAGFAVFACAAAIDWMWESTAVTVLALSCVLAAGGVGARSARGRRRQKGERIRARQRHLWVTGVAIAGILSIGVEIPGLVATERLRAAQAALLVGFDAKAQKYTSDAATAEPWAASPLDERALVEVVRGDGAVARRDALASIEAEPENFRRWLMLALVERQRGDSQAALRAYNKAHSLAPAVTLFDAGFKNALREGIRGLAP